MEEAFDPFDNSSESEIEIVEDEEVTVTEHYGSYDEETLEDREETSRNNIYNDNVGKDYINASNFGDAGFTGVDETDENYLDETVLEEVTEYDDDYEEELLPPSVASTDIISDHENQSFEYLSMSEADNSATEGSVKYDADLDAVSEQESSVSSYFSVINDDPRQMPQFSKKRAPKKINTIEDLSLRISSASLRTSSYGTKQLAHPLTPGGDNSIKSTRQSPLLRKALSKNLSISGRRSIGSESSTIDSRGAYSNSRPPLKPKRRGKARKSKSQRISSDVSPSIGSPGNDLEQQLHVSGRSTASRESSGATSKLNQLQRSTHYEQVSISPGSTTSSHSVYENFNANDGRCASIAVLGTTSGTGKGRIAAAMCRIFANGGTKCAPFKSQNTGKYTSPALLPDLSCRDGLYESFAATVKNSNANDGTNNGCISPLPKAPTKEQGYGHIGVAQSMQAEASKILPRVQMNPIFFKSEGTNENGELTCAMIVMGKQITRETYKDISNKVPALQSIVLDSHLSLSSVTDAEVIVIQGAGSCSELNLMDGDIANLPLVRCLQCPWFLVANDEIGGVFAQVIGTKMCVTKRDWALCAGVIINKVRSDMKGFVLGLKALEQMAGKPLYAVPFVENINSANEEAIDIESRIAWEKNGYNRSEHQSEAKKLKNGRRGKPSVVVLVSPHTTVSNDLCPLEQDHRFHIEWRRKRLPKPYPSTTAIILPGSRHPLLDMKWVQDSGWAEFIRMHVAAGGSVLGLCHGYQMLGWTMESGNKTKEGIGLLPISSTVKSAQCNLVNSLKGQLYPSGIHVEGFEVDCGFSEVVTSEKKNVAAGRYKGLTPLVAYSDGKPEGMRLGRVQGSYLHGILRSAEARVELLVPIQDRKKIRSILRGDAAEDSFDRFAKCLETSGLNHDRLHGIVFGNIS